MKFETHNFWRHTRSIDIFFFVDYVGYDSSGNDFILYGSWCLQGFNSWIKTRRDQIRVPPHEFNNWHEYEPIGKMTV